MMKIIKFSNREEWANTITHGIATILSWLGLLLLWYKASTTHDSIQFNTSMVFGATAIFLFTSSTTYHILRKGKWKRLFLILDHIAIYIFIAGTYTPICLVLMKDFEGENIFYMVWLISFIGIIYKIFFINKFKLLSLILYLSLGWAILIKWDILMINLPFDVIYWLILGGMFYTVGVIFFVWHKLKFSHAIWHLFVIAGSACHYYLIYNYVIAQ